MAFVRIGLSGCDIGVSWMLPRLIGASRAFELMLTGRLIDAEEAERICANSPFGVWMTKEVMWSDLEVSSMQAAIDLENRTQLLTSFTEDMQEAMAAFLEKRPPRFENR